MSDLNQLMREMEPALKELDRLRDQDYLESIIKMREFHKLCKAGVRVQFDWKVSCKPGSKL